MPAGIVQYDDHLVIFTRANSFGEGSEGGAECLDIDRVEHEPNQLPSVRSNKGIEIHPFEAVSPDRDRPLSLRCPNLSEYRLQTYPMFVTSPHGNARFRMERSKVCNSAQEFFYIRFALPASQPWRGAAGEFEEYGRSAEDSPSRAAGELSQDQAAAPSSAPPAGPSRSRRPVADPSTRSETPPPLRQTTEASRLRCAVAGRPTRPDHPD